MHRIQWDQISSIQSICSSPLLFAMQPCKLLRLGLTFLISVRSVRTAEIWVPRSDLKHRKDSNRSTDTYRIAQELNSQQQSCLDPLLLLHGCPKQMAYATAFTIRQQQDEPKAMGQNLNLISSSAHHNPFQECQNRGQHTVQKCILQDICRRCRNYSGCCSTALTDLPGTMSSRGHASSAGNTN